ncbi:choline/ethanolaminephosphotransferase 1-like [Varroa jacobsoni]|uniref:diacylglycerol cholinephosphotransferase n=1 Tax=Varroa destructor TaxID=109461 RepID=A0A7M7JQ67_VARDE|nr:choline/ethanolaminephosphotransferase 1-like [Varroa destructor]XP_022711483.1 choline/ethanolaminephosphotransferase 1-like [Varroa jacobsoni]XP_022711484.1 choline/ethanolaminephosphotransferase 1-like [Varroa jacobsoni]
MLRLPIEPLQIEQLKRLQQHQYRATGKSFLDPYMQPFWEWVVIQLPEWVAPNLMTITGLLVNVLTCLLLIVMAPDAKSNVHPLFFVTCAVGLFIYQTLDACDGKQARRTGSSSPLGELFDHGCDALSTLFLALGVAVAIRMGTCPYIMLIQCLVAMFLFYCAHWQTYVTGTLRFGWFDVTEAQFSVMGVLLITAIFGQEVWDSKIIFIEARFIPFIMCLCGAVVALFNYSRVCFSSQTQHVCEGSALAPLVPSLLTIVPYIVMAVKSPALIADRPCLALTTFGLVAVKLTFRIIVAHMTRSEVHTWDTTLLTPLTIFFNQYLDFPLSERFVLYAGLTYTTIDLFLYANAVCLQICEHLKIELFRITPAVAADKKNPTDDPSGKPLLKAGSPGTPSTGTTPGEAPPCYQDVIVNKS